MKQRRLATHYAQRFDAWSARHAQHPAALRRAIATYQQWLNNPAELVGNEWRRYGGYGDNGKNESA